MHVAALLAGGVLRVAPVPREDGRQLLHDVGQVERLAVQLVPAAVADPEEGLPLADGDFPRLAVLEDAQRDVAFDLVEELLALVDVIVAARVGPAHHRDHEIAVAFPDLRVADRRLEQVAVLVDPALEVERLEVWHGSLHGGDALQLDGDGRGERRDLHRGAAGLRILEVLGPQPVVGGEVPAQVGQEHGHVDQLLPARAGLLEHCAHVGEHRAALRLDVVALHAAVGAQLHPGDLARSAHARPDPGEEEQVPHAARVRIGPDGLRRALRFGQSAHSFTHTFLGSVKKRSASNPPSRPTPDSFMPPNGVRRSRSIQQFTHTIPESRRAATRCARERSRVQTEADRPYRVAFASCTAWSASSNGCRVATGPKISSWLVRQDGPRPSMTVGSTNHPSRQRPSTRARLPPQRTRPPSCRATSRHPITFSKCCRETRDPCSVAGSSGSPMRKARAAATSRSWTSSYTGRSTRMRDPHRQICPWFWNAARAVCATASSRSASAKIRFGFFPPISSDALTNLSAVRAAISRPTRVDPVKLTARTSG